MHSMLQWIQQMEQQQEAMRRMIDGLNIVNCMDAGLASLSTGQADLVTSASRAAEMVGDIATSKLTDTLGGIDHTRISDALSAFDPVRVSEFIGTSSYEAAGRSILSAPSLLDDIDRAADLLGQLQSPPDVLAAVSGLDSSWDALNRSGLGRDVLAEAARFAQIAGDRAGFLRNLELKEAGLCHEARQLLDQTQAFTSSYASLAESLLRMRESAFTLRDIAIIAPPVELFSHVSAMRAVFREFAEVEEEEAEELDAAFDPATLSYNTTEELNALLGIHDPRLLRIWRGAVNAVESRHPDYTRHFCTSARTLLDGALNRLAPDEVVVSWVSGLPGSQQRRFFDGGAPTRRARLFLILKGIGDPPFAAFLDNDIGSALALFEALVSGVHRLDADLTEREVRDLQFRLNHLLLLLFKAAS